MRLGCALSTSQVCYAISQLAAGFPEANGTSPMSPYFKDVVQALLETVRCAWKQLRVWARAGEGHTLRWQMPATVASSHLQSRGH